MRRRKYKDQISALIKLTDLKNNWEQLETNKLQCRTNYARNCDFIVKHKKKKKQTRIKARKYPPHLFICERICQVRIESISHLHTHNWFSFNTSFRKFLCRWLYRIRALISLALLFMCIRTELHYNQNRIEVLVKENLLFNNIFNQSH